MKDMNQNLKNIIRAGTFIILFALFFVLLSGAFIPAQNSCEDGMESRISKAYRGEPANSLDVVFVGNSDVYRAVSPVDLYRSTGITSAIAGKPNKNFHEIPKDIKDILKYQKPKVLVIETDCMFSGTNPQFKNNHPSAEIKKTIDKKEGSNKTTTLFKTIKNAVSSGDSAIIAAINYKFPLIKYHENWKNIKLKSFFNRNHEYKFSNKGMAYSDAVKPYNAGNDYMNSAVGKVADINKSKKKTFDKIYKLCKANNIKLLLVTVPSANTWNNSKSRAVQKIADEYKLKYYDYNVKYPDGFDWTTDSKDGGNHLNYSGAVKVTKDMGTKLKDDMGMKKTDLSKAEQKEWDKDYNHFHKKIAGK